MLNNIVGCTVVLLLWRHPLLQWKSGMIREVTW